MLFGIFPFTSYACKDFLGQYQCKGHLMEISKTFLGYRLIENHDGPIKLKCKDSTLSYEASIKEDGVTFAALTTMTRTEPGVHITTIATLEGIPVYFERSDCSKIQ